MPKNWLGLAQKKFLRPVRDSDTYNQGKITLSDQNRNFQSHIEKEIERIENQIIETNKSIFAAEKVKISSSLNQKRGFIPNLLRRSSLNAASKSSSWHFAHLKELLKERIRLQVFLDKSNGKFWSKRFFFIFRIFVLLFLIALSIGALLIGIMSIIYLAPICIFFILVYNLKKKDTQ